MMEYEFLSHFYPKVLGVYRRDAGFWTGLDYQMRIERTKHCFIGYIYAGTGTLEVNQGISSLREKQIFHFAKNQQMSIRTSPESTLSYITIHYDYKLLHWAGSELMISDDTGIELPMDRVIDVNYDDYIHPFTELYTSWNGKDAGYDLKTHYGFQRLLFELLVSRHESNMREDTNAKLINESLNYIKTHIHEPLDRDKLARMVAVTPSYYSVLFKKYTGHTLTHYIHKLRLDRSMVLLRSTNEPISCIAKEIGFADALYFTRLFTREIGCSPSEFRRG